ncbi:uncharacterized protein K02A2.6-like [Anopheles stephensi]|uniref:uncharacterized protein K02A2.6-like n=1 Tax=Anopheles stephensi TaxID=30069 RepID=UPI0016588507|nr:uncharacterized protein K02A2.6-like [Anopheles stephensi]
MSSMLWRYGCVETVLSTQPCVLGFTTRRVTNVTRCGVCVCGVFSLFSAAPRSVMSLNQDAETPSRNRQHEEVNGQPNGDWLQELYRKQQEMLVNQQQAFMVQQEQLISTILRTVRTEPKPVSSEQIVDLLAGSIKEFNYDPDARVTFAGWYARYEPLFEKDAERLDDGARVRLLLRKLGMAEHERYCSYVMPAKANDFDFATTLRSLKLLFGSQESKVSQRFKCLQLTKSATEDHVMFACRVNKATVEAELGGLSEEALKCLIFVCGLKDERDADIRMRLLSKIEERNDVTLGQLTEDCQKLINLRRDTAMIEGEVRQISRVSDDSKFPWHKKHHSQPQGSRPQGSKPPVECWLCGGNHFACHCSFKRHTCVRCRKTGHKEGFCDTASRVYRGRSLKRVRTVLVNAINSVNRGFVSVSLAGHAVRMMVDTGAEITIISERNWQRIGRPMLRQASIKAKSATGNCLELLGEFQCMLTIGQRSEEGTVRVTKEDLMLLGKDVMELFGLWDVPLTCVCNKVTDVTTNSQEVTKLEEYKDLFSHGLGHCTKMKVRLELKDDAIPVFRPKRPVSYAMLPAVDEELNRLEKEEIISRVNYSAWAAPIVVVRKANGSLRICGDYSTGLNNALRPYEYPLPLPQDIFANLANSTIFSQIDLTYAFLQIEVDEECRELLTVNTHRGLYSYNRLPPGVKVAPGAFQQVMETMLVGLKDVAVYLDDIVIGGADTVAHNKNIRAVLDKLKEYGFRIRPEKCNFMQQQIRYLGHILDRNGFRPDPAKIEAITKMPSPKQPSELR